jgi:hypothetical protein
MVRECKFTEKVTTHRDLTGNVLGEREAQLDALHVPESSGGQSFEPSRKSRPIFLFHGYELHAHALFGTTSLDRGTRAHLPCRRIQQ